MYKWSQVVDPETGITFKWNNGLETVYIGYPPLPDRRRIEIEIPGWILLEFVGRYLNNQTQEMLDNMSGTEFLRLITAEALA